MDSTKHTWTQKSVRNVVVVQDSDSNNEIQDVYSNRENVWRLITLRGQPYLKVGGKEAGKLIGSYSSFTRLLKNDPTVHVNVCSPGEVHNRYIISLRQLK